jgi:hypothetical protein
MADDGFDIVDVGAQRGAGSSTDVVETGEPTSRMQPLIDWLARRTEGVRDRISSLVVPVGLLVILAGVIVGVAVTTRGPKAPKIVTGPAGTVTAAGCPDVTRCVMNYDNDGPVARALGRVFATTALNAWTTLDAVSSHPYRTMVLASNGESQYSVISSCQPGTTLPNAQSLTARHVDSAQALPGFGPAVFFSMTLVRVPTCWVAITALVPDRPVVTGTLAPRTASTDGGVISTAVPVLTPRETQAALLRLAADPDIWLA